MTVNPALQAYVEAEILPRYTHFDKAHQLDHIETVIRQSAALYDMLSAQGVALDPDMVYTIAAYHDLGMSGPRAVHHINGGKILATDARLKKWFSPEQLQVMREAVEDHRASASHTPRSIYGTIVAEADRDIEIDTVIRRTIQFGLANYPELDHEGHWRRFKEHMDNKYSKDGYIRLWIPNSPNARRLNDLRNLIAQPAELRKAFEKIYLEVTSNF